MSKTLSLENLRVFLSQEFGFEIAFGKSFNIDYNMDGEEFIDGLYKAAEEFGCIEKELDKQYSYHLYFKQGILYPMKAYIRRRFGLPHDEDVFKEAVPLAIEDVYRILESCTKSV
ncbi:hypothetical protein [Phyllobacterium leguminum]|uniref:Uncharacterized protein n=1 Tax=Phyllobacterium leguminum TaxID=314237 RepID=A0A318SUS6_9HYPH|nr:hypothetical protein [Phyllobacterium leguminum]PYE85145.1 hypothetical protein C7477_1403 [Phyllobacterium leguminum]